MRISVLSTRRWSCSKRDEVRDSSRDRTQVSTLLVVRTTGSSFCKNSMCFGAFQTPRSKHMDEGLPRCPSVVRLWDTSRFVSVMVNDIIEPDPATIKILCNIN